MPKINIIVLGESGVGKTSLLKRFITGNFRENSTKSTFVDYHAKSLKVQDKEVDIIVWDTAGQELYNSLIKRYYAMADGVLLVYDVNDTMTFSKLSKWLSELRLENETAEIIIAGNKNEDPENKMVKTSDVKNFAEKENLEYTVVSAMTGENVDMVFQNLTEKILMAKGILPLPMSHQNSDAHSTSGDSRNSCVKEKEPEISFTYYKGPDQPKNRHTDETDNISLHERTEENSKRCSC